MIGRIIWYFLKDVPVWKISSFIPFHHSYLWILQVFGEGPKTVDDVCNIINQNFDIIDKRILKLEQAHNATSKPSVKRKRKSGKHGKS